MVARNRLLLLLMVAVCALATAKAAPVIAQQKNCPGAPPSQLTPGGMGQVSSTPAGQVAIPVRVRQAPGRSGKVIGQINDGTTFQVIEGPTCADNYAWWHINANGLDGWAAEGDANNYFLDPVTSTDNGGNGSDNGGSDQNTQPTQTGPVSPTATLAPVTTGVGSEPQDRFAAYNVGDVSANGSVPPAVISSDFSNLVVSSALTTDQLS